MIEKIESPNAHIVLKVPKIVSEENFPQDPTTLPLILKNGAYIARSSLPLKNSYIRRRAALKSGYFQNAKNFPTCVTVGIMSHRVTCTACNVEHVAQNSLEEHRKREPLKPTPRATNNNIYQLKYWFSTKLFDYKV